jgi:hypothetical protein
LSTVAAILAVFSIRSVDPGLNLSSTRKPI